MVQAGKMIWEEKVKKRDVDLPGGVCVTRSEAGP